MYKNAYGYAKPRGQFTDPVAINMKHLKMILKENATPILDLICRSQRHEQDGTQPIEEVLIRVKSAVNGYHSALYVLANPYRVKPCIYKLKRLRNPVFKYDKEEMDKIIAGWSENYQNVCASIMTLSLEMNEEQCKGLIGRIRDEYIQEDRKMYIDKKISTLMKRSSKVSKDIAQKKAIASWEEVRTKRIAQLDEEHYDSLLFIENKFLEMDNKTEMPIYSLDEMGRLHYYLKICPKNYVHSFD
jgi:hypothetical protein